MFKLDDLNYDNYNDVRRYGHGLTVVFFYANVNVRLKSSDTKIRTTWLEGF